MNRLAILVLMLALSGCSYNATNRAKVDKQLSQATSGLDEASRELTTGALDSLDYAPSNAPVELARDLLKFNQGISGVPTDRIDVLGVLATNSAAVADLDARLSRYAGLIEEQKRLQGRIEELEGRLIDMGAKYEAERNKSIVKRIWHWTIGTLGVGGLIALAIFCPAVLPILGAIVGKAVGVLPKLAGFVGVVSRKAFDGVVKGVGEVRHQLKLKPEQLYSGADMLALLDGQLKAADPGEKNRALVTARREALNV